MVRGERVEMRNRFRFCLMAALLLQSSCYLRCGGPAVTSGHTAGAAPMATQAPAVWNIKGKTYQVGSTYYLALPEGLQFTIDYELPAEIELPQDTEAALAIALPLMQHAVESGLYQRSTIEKVGTGEVLAKRIGVALFKPQGALRRGFAVALSLEEIRQRAKIGV